MPEKLFDLRPLSGPLRWLARLPIALFRMRLGWMMGNRFLLLRHKGRSSGRLRETVLEVLHHDSDENSFFVASAWGARADWYKNLQADPNAEIEVGRRKVQVVASRLSPEEAGDRMLDYGLAHPAALRTLARVMGYRVVHTEEDMRALGQLVPVIALRPVIGENTP